MPSPAITTRTILLVTLVGVGSVIAGGGIVGAVDTVGEEHAPAEVVEAGFGPTAAAPSQPNAIFRPPGANVQPFEQIEGAGNGSSSANQSNSTGQADPGSNGTDRKETTSTPSKKDGGTAPDQTPATTPHDNGSGADQAPGQSDKSGGAPEQPPGQSNGTEGAPEQSPGSGTDTGAGPADTGPDQNPGHGSPPDDAGSGTGHGNATPGAGGHNNTSSGPPEWVDAPGGQVNGSHTGPPASAADVPNGTTHTISVGKDNVTVTVGHGPPSGDRGARVVAHVANATPNGSVPVDLPRNGNESVRTERLSVKVTDRQDFSLGVSTRTDRDENRTPAFGPENKAEGLGYISVDHTVPDNEIESVTFRFAVDADRITPSERGDVALYRHHNGSWNEVPTKYVARNDTAYVFEAESPGLSEFTVGKKVPAFEIADAKLLSTVQTTADPVSVRVRITNEGDADGVCTAKLLLNEQTVSENQLSIAAGGTRQTSFEESIEEPGEYTVLVNNYTVGHLDVEPAAVDSGTETSDTDANGSPAATNSGSSREETTTGGAANGVTVSEMSGFGLLAGAAGLLIVALSRRP